MRDEIKITKSEIGLPIFDEIYINGKILNHVISINMFLNDKTYALKIIRNRIDFIPLKNFFINEKSVQHSRINPSSTIRPANLTEIIEYEEYIDLSFVNFVIIDKDDEFFCHNFNESI
jgi:hypothetical protein